MKRIAAILLCLIASVGAAAQNNGGYNPLKDSIFYYYDRSDFEDVVRLGKQAVATYDAQGDLYDLAGCYNLLGNAYQRMGLFKEAIESYERCAQAMEQLKDIQADGENSVASGMYDRNIRYTRNNMAEVFLAIDELDRAEKLYRECVEMLGEVKDTLGFQDLATYKQNLAEVTLKRAEATKDEAERNALLGNAVGLAEQSVAISRRYDALPFKKTSKLVTLAHAYQAAGQIGEAVAAANEAQASVEAGNNPFLLTEIYALNGSLDASMGRYKEAEGHYSKALSMAKDNHFDVLQMTTLKGAYEAAKHFDKGLALSYLEELADLRDTLLRNEQQQIIRDYQVKYDLSEKEHQLTMETAKNRSNKQIIILLAILAVVLFGLFALGMRLSFVRKRQNALLAKINDAKDRIFSIVSHDFKTSVLSQNLMLGVMNRHIDQMSETDIKAKLLTLKTSSDSLRENMFNLIEWMKIEMGGGGNKRTVFNLCGTVGECLGAQNTEVEIKRLDVFNEVPPTLEAYDDAELVKLVLRNLISNAIKFSNEGGRIRITAEEAGHRIWIAVADNGIGISQNRIKELTTKVLSAKHGNTGSGIGLLLCRQLLEHNGESISIESEEGKGTTVRFSVKTTKQ